MNRLSHSLALLLAALAAHAAQAAPALRDFSLPPSTPTPTPDPNVQGPVDREGPVVLRPRVIPTDTPAPTPTPTAAPTAAASPALRVTPRVTLPTRTAPSPSAAARGPAAPAQSAATIAQPETTTTATAGTAAPPVATRQAGSVLGSLPTTAAPSISPPTAALPDSGGGGFALWPWLLALVAALGAAAGLYFWRNREAELAGVPQIELPPVTPRAPPPDPAPAPASAPAPAPAPAPTPRTAVTPPAPAHRAAISPLTLEAMPVQLSRSLMNATFAYKLTLANRGDTPIENVAIGVDLVTAHTSVPMEQQVSRSDTVLPEMGRVGSIAPGEKVELPGEVRLPLSAIRTVRQGSAQLYVPLLRVRASAAGVAPSARTFIVGTLPGDSAKKLQPFRLDEMPQTYRAIGTMALD